MPLACTPPRIMLEGRCAVAPESCQGCASPYAFETALRLLEIEEEIVGARMTRTTSQGVSSCIPLSLMVSLMDTGLMYTRQMECISAS